MTDLLAQLADALDGASGRGTLWTRGDTAAGVEAPGRVWVTGTSGTVVYDLPGVDLTRGGLLPVTGPAPDGAVERRIVLRGAARDLFARDDSEVTISGPAGTGKSLPCLLLVHLAAVLWPGARCLVARKVAATLGATTLVTFREKVAGDTIAAGAASWFGGSVAEPASWRYVNGSRVVVGGLDAPIKIMSSEYDLVFVDEATETTPDDWEAISTRLRRAVLPWQQQIGALNPGSPTHWLKQRADTGTTPMLASRHTDNPAYFDADGTPTPAGTRYLAILDKLSGVRKLRLRDGLWAAAEGVVYDGWDDAVHLVDAYPVPEAWPRWWSVDFGYTNPAVVQWWAEDPDGRLVLYRELYMTGRLVEDHARTILALVTDGPGRWTEPRPRAVICDHDAEDRATLERHLGLSTTPASKAVSPGIQAVQARLRPAGDGRPRLTLMRGVLVERDEALTEARLPASTAEEVGGYVWDTSGGKRPKEQPRKEHDHGMDAMRYVVAELDLGARPRLRWM